MKKATLVILLLFLVPFLWFKSCVIYHPEAKDCVIVSTNIIELRAGPTYDIKFKGSKGETYYINRGLEQGLNLDSLNALVLNKTVTLHLAKLAFGPTKHISQIAIKDQVIFTEFKN